MQLATVQWHTPTNRKPHAVTKLATLVEKESDWAALNTTGWKFKFLFWRALHFAKRYLWALSQTDMWNKSSVYVKHSIWRVKLLGEARRCFPDGFCPQTERISQRVCGRRSFSIWTVRSVTLFWSDGWILLGGLCLSSVCCCLLLHQETVLKDISPIVSKKKKKPHQLPVNQPKPVVWEVIALLSLRRCFETAHKPQKQGCFSANQAVTPADR